MEDGYDEELEKLLREIPRATSAPPHLEEPQKASKEHHQHSLEQVSQVDTPSNKGPMMQTLRHCPLLYTPYSEPLQTSALMGTPAYDDLSPSSNSLSPLYEGLPAPGYNVTACNKHVNSQSRHSIDLDFVYNGSLSSIASGHVNYLAFPARDHVMTFSEASTLQGESQSHAEHVKVLNSASLNDEGIDGNTKQDAPQSASAAASLSTSCLSSSLQSLVPFPQSGNERIEHSLDKLALEDWRLAQSQGQFVRPLDFYRAKQLSEQSFALPGPFAPNLTGAAPMHLGHQSPSANGAFLALSPATFVPPYSLNLKMVYARQMHEATAQQQIEERVLCRQRVKEEFLLRQQRLQEQQARFYASLQSHPEIAYSRYQSQMQHNRSVQAPNYMFDVVQQELASKETFGGGSTPERNRSIAETWASPVMLLGEAHEALGSCRYSLQGICTQEDLCPLHHSLMQNNSISTTHDLLFSEPSATLKGSRNGLFMPTGVVPTLKKKNHLANGRPSSHSLSNGTHLSSPHHLSGMIGGDSWKETDPVVWQNVNSQNLGQPSNPPPKYTTLKEIEGHIYGIAKDQHGCRFLQRKFEEGVSEDVHKIFVEIIDHVVELMTDPFGNYLVQKLLEVCDETQRTEILYKVTSTEQLVTISLNMHGTRAVQKLIETLSLAEQVRLVVGSLKQGVVTLIKDLNGNHVVQRCLQRLSTEDSQFIFDAAASHCVEIATHRHGCCVLQRCVDFSFGQQRNRLVSEIAANALVLSQDPFGNYVVQYILDLGLNWAIAEVIAHLDGNFVHLAMQKFSSNVVEKCLKLSGEESKAEMIQELMSSTRLAQLLQDPFANYVVQSALMVSKVMSFPLPVCFLDVGSLPSTQF
ncbi:hypothetical protein L7F22_033584 [Adiantum nelumboides]|nr:hypothetical protein [Adiantum nelumboides]